MSHIRLYGLLICLTALLLTSQAFSAADDDLSEDEAPSKVESPESATEAAKPGKSAEDDLLDFDNLENSAQEAAPAQELKSAPEEEKPPVAAASPTAEPQKPVAEVSPTPSAEAEKSPDDAAIDKELEAAEPPPAATPEPPIAEPVAPPPVETAKETPPAAPETPVSGEPDPSDLRREARYSKIFERFQKPQLSDQEWSGVVSSKGAPETYSIQTGDTLWDISTKLFGDGFYWPKVWQLNDKITNPHMIAVGNTLKFSPGNSSQPPSLDVEKAAKEPAAAPEEESAKPVDVPQASNKDEKPSGPSIRSAEPEIPPAKKRRPTLMKVPPSFPSTDMASGQYDADGFAVDDRLKQSMLSPLSALLPALISDGPWKSEGRILEIGDDQNVAATYQHILVEIPGGAETGRAYLVFNNAGDIKDAVTDKRAGTEIETRGELKIEDPVEVSGRKDVYRALVVRSTLPLRLGDSLKQGNLMRVETTGGGSTSPVAARILGGDIDRRVAGLYNVVYLNRGEDDGLQKGMLLNVLKNTRLRNPESLIRTSPKPIGILKVVQTGRHVATAYVVRETDAIIAGDETGGYSVSSASDTNDMPEPPSGGNLESDGDKANSSSDPDLTE